MPRKSKRSRQLQESNDVRLKEAQRKKILRLVPLDSKREVKLSSRLKNAGVNESIVLFLSMMYYVNYSHMCLYFDSHRVHYRESSKP